MLMKGKRMQWTFALDLSFNHQHEFLRCFSSDNCSSFDSISNFRLTVCIETHCVVLNMSKTGAKLTFKIDVTLSSNNRNESTERKTIAATHFHVLYRVLCVLLLHIIKWMRFSILFWILQLCFAAEHEHVFAVSFHSLMTSWKMNYPSQIPSDLMRVPFQKNFKSRTSILITS